MAKRNAGNGFGGVLMAEWFEGFDGQVVLEDDYVWIVREGIPRELVPPELSHPRRAARSAVLSVEFHPATEDSMGSIGFRLDGVDFASPVATVRFSPPSSDRFAELNRIFVVEDDEESQIPVGPHPHDRIRKVLADLGEIAERSEVANEIGWVPDIFEHIDDLRWIAVGPTWVAVGGSDAATTGIEKVRVLEQLIGKLPSDTGIKALTNAVTGTALEYVGPQRLGALWESVVAATGQFRGASVSNSDITPQIQEAPVVDVMESVEAAPISVVPDGSESATTGPDSPEPAVAGSTDVDPVSVEPAKQLKTKVGAARGAKTLSKLIEQVRSVVDERGGMATHGEITRALGVEVPTRGPHRGVVWGQVGGVRVAVGGSRPAPIADRVEQIRTFDRLIKNGDVNSHGFEPSRNSDSAALNCLSDERFAELCRAITSHSGTGRDMPALTQVNSARDVNKAPGTSNRIPTPREVAQRSITPFSGHRTRVYLDCDGHRIKALYDPENAHMEVTVAPVHSLKGATFAHPHEAASAVIAACRPGDDDTYDGWSVWRIDDRTERPLGEVRDLRRSS